MLAVERHLPPACNYFDGGVEIVSKRIHYLYINNSIAIQQHILIVSGQQRSIPLFGMAQLFNSLLGRRPSSLSPMRVGTDTVVPVRFFDDNDILRGVIMAWMFKFDHVLDPEKLHAAVLRLFDMPSWRHLGGRLRLNVRL